MEVILENNSESKEMMNTTTPAKNDIESMPVESNTSAKLGEADLKDSTHEQTPTECDSGAKQYAEPTHTLDSVRKQIGSLSENPKQTLQPELNSTETKESHEGGENFVQETVKEFEIEQPSIQPISQVHQENENTDQQKNDGDMSYADFIQTDAPQDQPEKAHFSVDSQLAQGVMSQIDNHAMEQVEEEIEKVIPTNEMQMENEQETKPVEQVDQAHLSLKELAKAGLLEPENEEDNCADAVHESRQSTGVNVQEPQTNAEERIEAKQPEMEEEEPQPQIEEKEPQIEEKEPQSEQIEQEPAVPSTQKKEKENTEMDVETPQKTENPEIQKPQDRPSALSKRSEVERTPKISLLESIKKSVENKERSQAKAKEEEAKKSLQKSQAKSETKKSRDTTPQKEETQDTRGKYTVGEDLKIMEYVMAHKGMSLTSRTFWQKAFDTDKLLNQKRSAESLRERYRKQLNCLTEADIQRMRKWVAENGEKGSINFKTKAQQESSGKIVYVKVLDNIEADTTQSQSKNASRAKTDVKEQTQEKAVPSERKTTEKKQSVPEKIKEPQSLTKSSQKESLLPKFNDALKNKMEIEMLWAETEEKENEKLANSTSKSTPKILRDKVELKEISAQNTAAKKTTTEEKKPTSDLKSEKNSKRKEYQDMQQIDQVMVPRKNNNKESPAPQPMSAMELLEMSKKEKERERTAEKTQVSQPVDKEAWLEEQAKKYHMTSDQITDVFYYCSMDMDLLTKYLQGERHLAWNEDEDTLLRGPAKTYARRILGRYKGEANVQKRVEFLEKIDQISAIMQGKSEKKQRSAGQNKGASFL